MDPIDRQEALDAICDNCDAVKASCPHYPCSKYVALEKLPPAQPEQKKGKWIKKLRVTKTEKYISYDSDWYCSCCGTKYDSFIAGIVNFCYVCGADMRGEKDECNCEGHEDAKKLL